MDSEKSGGGRTIGLIILVLVVLAAIAWAAGLFNVDTSGSLKAPEVSVKGGEVPDVQVETAKVSVGSKQEPITVPDVHVDTKKTSVTVPTVSVDKPGDDGSARK